jgi:hypothetical protein
VLLLDQLHTFFEKQEYARSEVSKFLKSAPESEQIAIYLIEKDLRVIQDFNDNSGADSETAKKLRLHNFFIGLQNAADMGATDGSISASPMYVEIRLQLPRTPSQGSQGVCRACRAAKT